MMQQRSRKTKKTIPVVKEKRKGKTRTAS